MNIGETTTILDGKVYGLTLVRGVGHLSVIARMTKYMGSHWGEVFGDLSVIARVE